MDATRAEVASGVPRRIPIDVNAWARSLGDPDWPEQCARRRDEIEKRLEAR